MSSPAALVDGMPPVLADRGALSPGGDWPDLSLRPAGRGWIGWPTAWQCRTFRLALCRYGSAVRLMDRQSASGMPRLLRVQRRG